MKFYDVSPLSPEWRQLRLGLVTASNFHKIITPKTMKLSSQAQMYMNQLLGEWLTGEEVETYQSDWMARGQEVEDQIWKSYEAYTEVETSRGGFFIDDAGLIGCSPDRLVGMNGDLEAKAPMIQTQISYALDGLSDDYKCQVQGRMMIHEREWVDLFAWHPQLFIPPIRIFRDDKFIAVLRTVLGAFVDQMLEKRLVLEREFGPFVRREPDEPPADDLVADVEYVLARRKEIGHEETFG